MIEKSAELEKKDYKIFREISKLKEVIYVNEDYAKITEEQKFKCTVQEKKVCMHELMKLFACVLEEISKDKVKNPKTRKKKDYQMKVQNITTKKFCLFGIIFLISILH